MIIFIILFRQSYPLLNKEKQLKSNENIENLGNGVYILRNEIDFSFNFDGNKEVKNVTSINIAEIPSYCFSSSSIEYFQGDENLKTISKQAFSECQSLKEVKLGKVTTIEISAFMNCINLISVSHSEPCTIREKAFYYCLSLKNFDFLKIKDFIEESAFEYCTSLTDLTLQNGLVAFVFRNCFGLRRVEVTECLEAGEEIFKNCIHLTEFIGYSTRIGSSAFENCISLTNYTSKCEVSDIDSRAFYNCSLSSLDGLRLTRDADLDDSCFAYNNFSTLRYPIVRYSHEKIFEGCINLENVEFISGSIPDSCFKDCFSLRSINFQRPIDSIKENAFINCNSLISITVKTSSLGNGVFSNCHALQEVSITCQISYIPKEFFYNCQRLKQVTFSSDIISINDEAFYGCNSVVTIHSLSKVQTVGNFAFYGCNSFSDYSIFTKLISIGENGFSGCNFSNLEIPETLSSIEISAFEFNNFLKSVTFKGDFNSNFGGCFNNCNILTNVLILGSVKQLSNNNEPFSSFSNVENITILGGIDYVDSATFPLQSTLKYITIRRTSIIKDKSFKDFSQLLNIEIGEFTSIGNYAFSGCTSIQNLELAETCNSIGEYAFCNCSLLSRINIPYLVTSLSNYIFFGCGFVDIVIPENIITVGEYSFSSCKNLQSISLPTTISSIPNGLFCNCSSLLSFAFNNNIKSIGKESFFGCSSITSLSITAEEFNFIDYCFFGCTSLTTINIASKTITLGSYSFSKCPIPSFEFNGSIRSIGSCCFYECHSLESITIHSNIPKINDNAFSNIMYVNSITIVGDISSIGSKAFSNSPSIKFILIKGSITFKSESFQDIPGLVSLTIGSTSQIPSYSFTHCDYLETFEILNNIRSVSLTNNAFSNHNIKKIIINSSISFQSSPFDNCNLLNYLFIGGSVSGNYENALNAIDKLENITIAGRIDLISSNTFNSQSTLKEVRLFNAYAIKENSFKDYTNLKYVEIKSSSSSLSIGNSTFSGCTSLVDIKLPDSIQSIGSYLLSGCSSLSVINLPNRLTSISSFMLSNCVLIESLIIPESVRSIGNNAFSNCAKLSQITFQSKTIELNGFCFNNCPLIIDFTFSGTKITLNSYCFSGAECIVNVKIECDTINFNDNCFTNSNVQHVLVNGSVYLGNQIYSEHMQTILIDGNINKIMNTSFSNSASLSSFTSTKTISYQSYNGQYISFSGCINLSSVSFSATMTELIPMFCFANCVKLSSFVIPQSVRQIKEYAFSGCNSLTSIDIPGQIGILGNNIFESCSSLTEVTFQQNRNIGTIPDGCFKSCTSLTTISIPSNIKNIGSRSFYNCNQLSSIQGLTSFSKIGEYAFYKCSFSTLDINGNSLNINQRAFDSCGELANITITGSINSISEYSFSNCPKLVFVNFSCTILLFPSNVFYSSPNIEQVYFYRLTTLGENSFHSNTKLQLIEIQEQLQEIQQNSFYQCSNLASVSFPNTLTIIGSFAFYRCSKLIYLSFSSLTSIGESAFESCAELLYVQLYGSYPTIPVKAFKSCSKLNGVGFDNAGTITEIRDEAFYQCTSINISLLPFYSLQRIGRSSFCQCDYLKKLLLSPCVTTIDEFAFYRCNSLYVVRLPPRLITLGKSAFYECRNLESINLSIFMNSVEEYSFANTRIKQVIIYPGIIVKPNAFKNCNELVNIEVYSDCTICPNAFTFQNKINLYLADNAQLLSNSLSNHIESIYYLGKEDNCLDEMVNELHRIYEPKPNVFIYVSRKYKNSTFAQYPVKSISITLPEAIDNYDCSAIILTEKQCHFRFDNFNLFSNFVFFISLIK